MLSGPVSVNQALNMGIPFFQILDLFPCFFGKLLFYQKSTYQLGLFDPKLLTVIDLQ